MIRIELEQRLPTRRAGGMQDQPLIYALDMEAMVAPREEPDVLSLDEVSEADGAVGGRSMQRRRVDHRRDPDRQGLLGSRRGRLARGTRRAAAQEAADHRVEAERTEQCTEESSQYYDHVAVEVGLAVVGAVDLVGGMCGGDVRH